MNQTWHKIMMWRRWRWWLSLAACGQNAATGGKNERDGYDDRKRRMPPPSQRRRTLTAANVKLPCLVADAARPLVGQGGRRLWRRRSRLCCLKQVATTSPAIRPADLLSNATTTLLLRRDGIGGAARFLRVQENRANGAEHLLRHRSLVGICRTTPRPETSVNTYTLRAIRVHLQERKRLGA